MIRARISQHVTYNKEEATFNESYTITLYELDDSSLGLLTIPSTKEMYLYCLVHLHFLSIITKKNGQVSTAIRLLSMDFLPFTQEEGEDTDYTFLATWIHAKVSDTKFDTHPLQTRILESFKIN